MAEKSIMIDSCYIIGTALLFKTSLDREFFDKISSELLEEYDVNLSQENIIKTVKEWKDFFRFTEDNRVIFTKQANLNKNLVRFLFCDILEQRVYDNLLHAILNKKIKKVHTKKLRFPK